MFLIEVIGSLGSIFSLMSPPTTSRPLLRQARLFARQRTRQYASATEAASSATAKSKDAASNISSKASQGLSRVTSAAGPAVSGAVQGIQKRVAGIGGRAGRLISFVECELNRFSLLYSLCLMPIGSLSFLGIEHRDSPCKLDIIAPLDRRRR